MNISDNIRVNPHMTAPQGLSAPKKEQEAKSVIDTGDVFQAAKELKDQGMAEIARGTDLKNAGQTLQKEGADKAAQGQTLQQEGQATVGQGQLTEELGKKLKDIAAERMQSALESETAGHAKEEKGLQDFNAGIIADGKAANQKHAAKHKVCAALKAEGSALKRENEGISKFNDGLMMSDQGIIAQGQGIETIEQNIGLEQIAHNALGEGLTEMKNGLLTTGLGEFYMERSEQRYHKASVMESEARQMETEASKLETNAQNKLEKAAKKEEKAAHKEAKADGMLGESAIKDANSIVHGEKSKNSGKLADLLKKKAEIDAKAGGELFNIDSFLGEGVSTLTESVLSEEVGDLRKAESNIASSRSSSEKAEASMLKGEAGELKAEAAELRAEAATLRAEAQQMKEKAAGLKEGAAKKYDTSATIKSAALDDETKGKEALKRGEDEKTMASQVLQVGNQLDDIAIQGQRSGMGQIMTGIDLGEAGLEAKRDGFHDMQVGLQGQEKAIGKQKQGISEYAKGTAQTGEALEAKKTAFEAIKDGGRIEAEAQMEQKFAALGTKLGDKAVKAGIGLQAEGAQTIEKGELLEGEGKAAVTKGTEKEQAGEVIAKKGKAYVDLADEMGIISK